MKIVSAKDLLDMEMGEPKFLWGDLLRKGSRIALIGPPKTAKSFFVIQLGLSVATGKEFLGMETERSNVLYVNFEIAEEMLQRRLQDSVSELGIEPPSNFVTATVRNIALEKDSGREQLADVIASAGLEHGTPDLVILDPRRNSMESDENQSEILTAWCANVDSLRDEFGFTTLIVHHVGKSTNGVGRGSSVFDGWVDGHMALKPDRLETSNTAVKKATLALVNRDTESRDMFVELRYPLWNIDVHQRKSDQSKSAQCVEFMLEKLGENSEWELVKLRTEAFRSQHSEYAIRRALKGLEADDRIEVVKDKSKQGNYKLVRLLPEEAADISPS